MLDVNKKYGRLTPLRPDDNTAWYWFKCDCGAEVRKLKNSVIKGHYKSCGCIRRGQLEAKCGLSATPESYAYYDMIKRCYNTNFKHYDNWGGRGIKVCDRWRDEQHGFMNFLNDIGKRPSNEYSIERIDNDGDYTPDNCRWDVRKNQQRNTRRRREIKYDGEMYHLYDIAKLYNVKPQSLWYYYFTKKLPLDEAVMKASNLRPKYVMVEYRGKTMTLDSLVELTGLPKSTLYTYAKINNIMDNVVKKKKIKTTSKNLEPTRFDL